MEQTTSDYRCWIIAESVSHLSVLSELGGWLISEKVAEMPEDEEPIWHIREYRIPPDERSRIISMLESTIKPKWYIHMLSKADSALYVILSGRSFKLPLVRDERWEPMIQYGLTVGVERRWTESIPVDIE